MTGSNLNYNHKNGAIILFDGVCKFCNGSVNFIIRRDQDALFQFAPLQGETAKNLIQQFNIDERIDSIILIRSDKVFTHSDALFEIIKDLDGYWYLLGIFKIVPRFIRDFYYDLFASWRYRLFGKHAQCLLPTNELRERFFD